ncbi:MAG TPA: 50S ribosomal protein L11 methyltransferase [Solirubrobacteraceae bacterium]
MIRLALRVQRASAELVLAELLELAPSGVEEIDKGGDTVEYAVYGSPGELPELPDVRAAAAGALVEVSTSEIPDDWDERWKQFHSPVLVEAPDAASFGISPGAAQSGASPPASSLYVRAPWQPQCELRGVEEVVIEPARAFGTGAHHTTRLTLSLLLELAGRGVRGGVLDVGTGSGVLAIAAAKLGFAPVRALDHDPESVEAAIANALANGVEIDVERHDIREQAPPVAEVSILLANLLRPLLLELAESMTQAPEHLLISGLLRGEASEVAEAFARHSLSERRRLEAGEWAAVWLTRSED